MKYNYNDEIELAQYRHTNKQTNKHNQTNKVDEKLNSKYLLLIIFGENKNDGKNTASRRASKRNAQMEYE